MNNEENPSTVEGKPDPTGESSGHLKRPIDQHGDYDGTDVGFTSTAIQDSEKKINLSKNRKKSARPIDKHGNYDGTDAGFTSNSFSDPTFKD